MSIASLCRRLFGRAQPQTPQPVLLMQPMAARTPEPAPGREPARPVLVAQECRGRATPRRSRRAVEPVALPAAELAHRLLQSCRLAYSVGEEVLQEDIEVIYECMCALEGLEQLPWRDVGAELRKLTGGRKTYKWVQRNGRRHRLRVYRMPPVASAPAIPSTAAMRRAA